MSFRDCLIVQRTDDWFIVVGSEVDTVSQSVTDEELVTCVNLMIKIAGLQNPRCILAPASRNCFFTALSVGNEFDLRDRDALSYQLEDHLPLDAESMVADFVVIPEVTAESGRLRGQVDTSENSLGNVAKESAPNFVSAVAIEANRWKKLAESLEASGIEVRSIIPSAILATRSLCESEKLTELVEIILCDDGRADLLTLGNNTILAWKHLDLDANTLQRHKLLDSPPTDVTLVVATDTSTQGLIDEVYGKTEHHDATLEIHWTRGAEISLSKQTSRWFDLRRDQLSPSDPLRPIAPQLRWVAISTAACLLTMIWGGWWRTQRINVEIQRIQSAQQTAFKQTFPGVKVPAALMRRVRSEHARIMGSLGTSTEVEIPRSGPKVLRDLLRGLPDDVRFRITRLSILNGRVDLDLQVRSPVDAGALATSLSESGFEVEPPVTTRKDAKTFDSILEANWIGTTTLSGSNRVSPVRVSIRHEVRG